VTASRARPKVSERPEDGLDAGDYARVDDEQSSAPACGRPAAGVRREWRPSALWSAPPWAAPAWLRRVIG